eukprot:10825512-Alexandrium_andersonii.AAC.1
MSASLVGSEMCIRDSCAPASGPSPTCFARAGSPGTRRDYVLRTAALAPLVAGFQVEMVAALATHCALHVDLK